ncbi:MAG: bacterio-opsin activator domain-containing protein [Haloarculaceae archaeon]
MSTSLPGDGQFLRAVVATTSHGVVAVDSAGSVVFSNGVLEGSLGADADEILDAQIDDLCEGGQALDRIRGAVTSGGVIELGCRTADGGRARLVATCESVTFEDSQYFILWCQEHVLGERKTSDDSRRDESRPERVPVEELTAIGRALLRAEDIQTVAETGLAGVTRHLGTDLGCIRLVDGATDDFARVATTDRASEALASRPTFDLNRSLAGRAFRRGEPVLDTPRRSDGPLDRANLHVPLEGKGTLTVFGSGGDLTKQDVELVEHVASLVAANLARVDAGPADSDSSTDWGADDLPIADVVTHAVEGDTVEDIGRRVCERLVSADRYGAAWFVSTDVDGMWRTVEASAGETGSLREGIKRAVTEVSDSDDGMGHAVETDDVYTVQRQQTVRNGNDDGQADREETVETTTVVPVSHGDQTYGVLVLRSDSDREFDSGRQPELAMLGSVVGLSIYAAVNKKLLLSEKVQQLEFEVTDPDCLAVTVSDAADASCKIEHQTVTNDGNHLCFLQVEGTTPETALDATTAADSVTDCRVVDSQDDGCLLEVVKSRSGAEAMMDVGATVVSATAEDGIGTLVVETPISTDVREVVEAYTSLNPRSHLVAKREIDRPVAHADSLTEDFDDALTERQQSVLTTAYYAGYFDWPRGNTAEEVADSLDISPATFHQHIRAAERKLLNLVCDDQE